MKFIDFFSGVGGFREGMQQAGHQCVGFCEFDKFAVASYVSMHCITEDQRKHLETFDFKKRQKEILKEEYRNGEWYSNDIRNVDAGSVPKCDCWCFGAPCQDFSVAGKRAGLDGDRSSLIREVFRVLGEIEEEDRPEWLLYENVKGMFSSNRGFDYLEILLAMDELGYDIEWQIFNSKDWGVPQNRERVYTVGHLRKYGERKILPITGTDEKNRVSVIGHRDGYRQNTLIFDPNGISETLQTCAGGGREPHTIKVIGNVNPSGLGMNGNVYSSFGKSPSLTTNKGEGNKIAIPVLTPDRAEKRQNGRRFKENEEPMFTLTGQDRHGIAIEIKEAMNTHGENRDQGIFVQLSEELTVYAVWYEKYQCYIAIRKLTPRECFRLQGWTDDYFEKAEFVNSDSQLYKQAGNGVTVSVVKAIAEKMR